MIEKRKDGQVWFELKGQQIELLPKEKYKFYNNSYDVEESYNPNDEDLGFERGQEIVISVKKEKDTLGVFFWQHYKTIA